MLLAAGRARAQSAEAEALFEDGAKLMAAGQIAQACQAFQESNRVEQRAGTLIRLGECREANHQIASAWSAYKDALTRVRDPRKRAIAEAKVAELEPKLSYLTVVVPDATRVAGLAITQNGKPLDRAVWGIALPVDGGDYVIAGQAPAHRSWTAKVSVPETGGKVSVEVPKLADAPASPPPRPAAPALTAIGVERAAQIEAPSRFTPRRKLAVGAAGVGAVGLAAGIALGVQAQSKHDQAHQLCADPSVPCADADRATQLASSSHALAIDADIAFGVGAGALVGAAVLWLTGAPERAHHVTIVPSTHGFTVVGSF